jgi:hypothetical protein
MVQAYKLIYKEEGLVRGLYSGITPAMLGSGNKKKNDRIKRERT